MLAGFDVPAIWTRNDDDLLSVRIVRAAEHALSALGPTGSAQRSRLLSTLALELRGTTTDRGRRARTRPRRSPGASATPACWPSRSTPASCTPSTASVWPLSGPGSAASSSTWASGTTW
ncbi:hypothetical protein NKG94_20450 [Micromonospora sp. M12]